MSLQSYHIKLSFIVPFSNVKILLHYLYPRTESDEGYDSELDSDKTYTSEEKKSRERLIWLEIELRKKIDGSVDLDNLKTPRVGITLKSALSAARDLVKYLKTQQSLGEEDPSHTKQKIIEDLDWWIQNPNTVNKRLLQEKTAAVQAAVNIYSYVENKEKTEDFFSNVDSRYAVSLDLSRFMSLFTKKASLDGGIIGTPTMLFAARGKVKLTDAILSMQRLMLYLDERMEKGKCKTHFKKLSNYLSFFFLDALVEVSTFISIQYNFQERTLSELLIFATQELQLYFRRNQSNLISRLSLFVFNDFQRKLEILLHSIYLERSLGDYKNPPRFTSFPRFLTLQTKGKKKKASRSKDDSDLLVLNGMDQVETLGPKVPFLANLLQTSAKDACLFLKKCINMYIKSDDKKRTEEENIYIQALKQELKIVVNVFLKCNVHSPINLDNTKKARDAIKKAQDFGEKIVEERDTDFSYERLYTQKSSDNDNDEELEIENYTHDQSVTGEDKSDGGGSGHHEDKSDASEAESDASEPESDDKSDDQGDASDDQGDGGGGAHDEDESDASEDESDAGNGGRDEDESDAGNGGRDEDESDASEDESDAGNGGGRRDGRYKDESDEDESDAGNGDGGGRDGRYEDESDEDESDEDESDAGNGGGGRDGRYEDESDEDESDAGNGGGDGSDEGESDHQDSEEEGGGENGKRRGKRNRSSSGSEGMVRHKTGKKT